MKTAKAFGVPIVHSTVNVASGRQLPTVPELAELLEEYPPIDRTTLNSWEHADFLAAVRATGRRKLILCALWTEICMAFPALDAMREGYDVYPVVDAIGGTSEEAHRAGIQRVVRAGANPVSWVALACELQRDWARLDTGRRDRAHRATTETMTAVASPSRAFLGNADSVLERLIDAYPEHGENLFRADLPAGAKSVEVCAVDAAGNQSCAKESAQ